MIKNFQFFFKPQNRFISTTTKLFRMKKRAMTVKPRIPPPPDVKTTPLKVYLTKI